MQTDIPLKRLTALRAEDLLPLLGEASATVAAVETLELPATATRLDNVIRLRDTSGREHLHVIEWQGYHDRAVLWRLASYLAWLGQRNPELPVIGTVIYLTPDTDVGSAIRQTVGGRDVIDWRVPTVRLWELDAADAVRQGGLGLTVLSPLMQGATVPLVEEAIAQVLAQAPLPQQADLLSILGVFAEPLVDTNRFIRLVGRETLMASDLLTYLMDEKLAEVERRYAGPMQQAVEDVVVARFPNTPVVLVRNIRAVTDPDQLGTLLRDMLHAPDQAAAEAILATIGPSSSSTGT